MTQMFGCRELHHPQCAKHQSQARAVTVLSTFNAMVQTVQCALSPRLTFHALPDVLPAAAR